MGNCCEGRAIFTEEVVIEKVLLVLKDTCKQNASGKGYLRKRMKKFGKGCP